MILTPEKWAEMFKLNKKKVSARTVRRRCRDNMLPSGHIPKQLAGGKSAWIIEIVEV